MVPLFLHWLENEICRLCGSLFFGISLWASGVGLQSIGKGPEVSLSIHSLLTWSVDLYIYIVLLRALQAPLGAYPMLCCSCVLLGKTGAGEPVDLLPSGP